jgi:GcrA cell cycle regulator
VTQGAPDKKRNALALKLATFSPEKIDETVAELVDQVEASAAPVTILDLTSFTCRWPLGDPTTVEFRFCGAPSPVGRPYCAPHSRIAHQ